MDFLNIEEINQKHNINLDSSILLRMQDVPDDLPQWKKAVIKLKNQKLVEKAIEEAIANKDPYAGVPEWKKDILKKRDSEKAEMERKITEEEKIKMEKENQLKAIPDWKKNLITRRLSKDHGAD